MLPLKISRFIDKVLIAIFNQLPVRLLNRVLWLLQNNPAITDKWGYFIRQIHYYEPLPDFAKISNEQVRQRHISDCIDWKLEDQLDVVRRLSNYSAEIQSIVDEAKFDFYNDSYLEVDATVYYSIIRDIKPEKIIEIGSGYSTQIASIAIAKNQEDGKDGKIICIEPYPQPKLTDTNLQVEIITDRVETIDLSVFKELNGGDILFIDSTHTVKFGSDVCREILEILPALASGVWVHFHDIFFPYDYPPKWLIEERRAWNEQYMLEAFLAYNDRFEVILANHWLSVDYSEEVAKIWSGVLNWKQPYHNCGGFWIRKK